MSDKVILLLEDSPDNGALTLWGLKKNNILNKVIVARDEEEALEYLFGAGKYESCDTCIQPQVVLLVPQWPKINGLEVFKCLLTDKRTMLLVMILIISGKEMDIIASYENEANSDTRKPVDFNQLIEVVRQLGLYWLILNEMSVKRGEN